MVRSNLLKFCILAALIAGAQVAAAADADPCTRFSWDVTRELAVMKQTPQALAAGVNGAAEAPRLKLDTLYDLKLAGQNTVSFVATPGKPTLPDGAQGGLVEFKVQKAGRYRISITSGHWIDIVDGKQILKSRDFQGQRGCERPHKIVEYELPAGRDLWLQFSGSSDARVLLAITAVAAPTG